MIPAGKMTVLWAFFYLKRTFQNCQINWDIYIKPAISLFRQYTTRHYSTGHLKKNLLFDPQAKSIYKPFRASTLSLTNILAMCYTLFHPSILRCHEFFPNKLYSNALFSKKFPCKKISEQAYHKCLIKLQE